MVDLGPETRAMILTADIVFVPAGAVDMDVLLIAGDGIGSFQSMSPTLSRTLCAGKALLVCVGVIVCASHLASILN